LKLNTGGGQLSGFYMWGMTPLSEAVIQVRGQGGQRQVGSHSIALVSGNGRVFDHRPRSRGPLMAVPMGAAPRDGNTAAFLEPAQMATGRRLRVGFEPAVGGEYLPVFRLAS